MRFEQTSVFAASRPKYFTEDTFNNLKEYLQSNPKCGKVMPGCHGLRKLRLADSNRGKGKRGGLRLIYLYLKEVDPHIIVFFLVYDKDERKDINLKEQKNLSRLVDKVKVEVIMSAKGSR